MPVLDDGELVDGEPVVACDVVEIDEAHLVAFDDAVVAIELDIDAFGDQAVDAAVLFDERGFLDRENLLDGLSAGVGWDVRVYAVDGTFEAVAQDDVAVALAFRADGIWGDLGAVGGGVAEACERSSVASSMTCSANPLPNMVGACRYLLMPAPLTMCQRCFLVAPWRHPLMKSAVELLQLHCWAGFGENGSRWFRQRHRHGSSPAVHLKNFSDTNMKRRLG